MCGLGVFIDRYVRSISKLLLNKANKITGKLRSIFKKEENLTKMFVKKISDRSLGRI